MSESQYNHQIEGEERLADRYGRFVIRHRKVYLLVVLVITLFLSWYVKDLDIRNEPDTLLPPSNRYVATNAYSEENFGMGNLMVFAMRVKDGDIYQPWFINMIQKLHERVEALPESRPENFIDLAAKKIKYMGADENGLVFRRLIPTGGISTTDPELAKEQLAFLKDGIENNPVLAPMLVSMVDAQGNKCKYAEYQEKQCVAKAAYIIADYTDDVKSIYLPWVRQVTAIIDEFAQDERVELLVAGEPYFLAFMLADLVDHWWLFVISLVIAVAVLWYEFRNWRGAAFPMLGVGATILMTLGLMGFTQFKLTTMMVLTPMLLLAIGIGHSVQITRRFMQEQARLGDCTKAAEVAIGHTIIPALLSIITDMIGFATLATVDISFYKDYAYFGMFGMLTLLFTTTTMIPLLMILFPCSSAEATGERAWEHKVGAVVSRLVSGPGVIVPIGITAAIIAISAHYTKIAEATAEDIMPGVERGIDYSRAAFKKESITIDHITKLNQIMPGVISVTIPIRGKAPLSPSCVATPFPESLYDIEDTKERQAQCERYRAELGCWDPDPCGAQGIFNNADVLGDIEKMENWLRQHPFIGFTGSYAQYVRLVNMLLIAEPGEKPSIDDLHIPTREYLTSIDPDDDRDPTGIVQMYNGLLETMTEEGDMDSFVSRDWNEGVVMGFVNTMDPKETHQVTMDMQQYVEDHKNDTGFRLVHFGLRNADTSGDTNELSREGPDYTRPGVGGFLGATEATREVAMDNFISGPMLTAGAVFAVAVIIFRSFIVSGILISLLFVTLFAQYGLGGYLTSVQNWSGNLAFHVQVALSIAMGLGIDYGIYMISRLREEMQTTAGDWAESLRNTLNTTGSAVIISVAVLLGAFIPLMNTHLANTWSVALYISMALIIDVITALTLLPMMVRWLKPRYVFSAHAEAKPA